MGGKRGRPSGKNDPEPTSGKKKLKGEDDYSLYQDIANWLRIDAVRAVHVTKSGHPTSSASIADILSVLFFHQVGLKFHPKNTSHFLNDRIVLSKGHAAPGLYAAFYRAGIITQENLLSLRLKDSLIEGHPVPKIPFVDIATGSLGQGLSVACGMAYSSKYFDKIDNMIYCITGDGQIAQGSIWQAADFARNYNLDNLITFVDVNALGQSQQTMHQHHTEVIKAKFAAFGWDSIQIDGHSFADIINTLAKVKANRNGKPKAIIARTQKGKGFNGQIQGKLDWHGKDLGKFTQQVITNLKSSIKNQNIQFKTYAPEGDQPALEKGIVSITPNYEKGSIISTRKAYGNGLTKARQSNPNVVGLDGDTKNSTFSITLKNKFPESFIQCFIAQQNMVGVSQGLACRRKIPFCSTFACFFIRAADQIRIGGISRNTLKCVGSHSGCSIGEDGPSQMALEDLAFFRTLPNGIVLVPSDGVSTQKAVQLVANYNEGPSFIRTGRPEVKVIYDNSQIFQLGKCKVPIKSQSDQISLISIGVTVHQCLKAAQTLKAQGINARVIDVFSVKPLDVQGIKESIQAASGNVVIVQQHYPQGGLYDAICGSVLKSIKKVVHLSVSFIPGSATPEQQLQIHGLDHDTIAKKARELLSN